MNKQDVVFTVLGLPWGRRGICDILCKWSPLAWCSELAYSFSLPIFSPKPHDPSPPFLFQNMKFKCSVDCINEYLISFISNFYFFIRFYLLMYLFDRERESKQGEQQRESAEPKVDA